ncbi:G-protein coupled receptor Mth-like [Zophobas morio]|uniref:G-protein coupled receptor Mth-like n=1 Tax=Zophobas morio TaxID=2755281 RepID=UPI003082D815
MLRLLLVLLTVRNCVSVDYLYPKCCDSESHLEEFQSTFLCVEDENKTTQFVTNRTNFVGAKEEGLCIDVEKTVGLFNVSGSDLVKVEELDVPVYSKCCPLNYFYNSTSHGCVKSENELPTFFRESFVKVGLRECKIIADVRVNTHDLVIDAITKYKKTKDASGQYCVDKDQNNLFVVRVCHSSYDVCDKIRCIRKCCLDGQSFINGSHCRYTFAHGLDLSPYANEVDNVNDPFAIIHDWPEIHVYALGPGKSAFRLDSRGTFIVREIDESLGKINVTRHYDIDQKEYCTEHATKPKLNAYLFFRGFPHQQQIKFVYTGIAMAISCFFLALTIIYYCISDEKRTLFGKILISYCSASFLALLLLSYFGLNTKRPEKGAVICKVIAFVIFYLTLAVITWMNVMCIDIYCTFGSSKSFSSRQHRGKDLKRFLLYCLHGWGTPLFLTILPIIFYHTNVMPFELQIIIKEEKCFLYKGDGNYAQFLFSTVPFAIMTLCNLILFVKTAIYCLQVKKEINKMNDTHLMKGEKWQKFNKFRDRFGLLLKLFFIMGISFLFEVVSTFYDFKKDDTTAIIEIIWDTFNCLQGVFIFAIFILKKRIFKKFQTKIGLQKLRKISLVSSAATQTSSLATLTK